MNFKIILLSVLLLVSTIAYDQEHDILVLHDSDFPQVLQDFPDILIEFYAPWCGHCQKLEPVYKEVAAELKSLNLPVRVAKVDATVEKTSATTYEVKGFPTLIYFHNGQKIPFNGQRTQEYLVNWLKKKVSDPVIEINQQQYEKLQASDKLSIVFHGDVKSGNGLLFKNLAIYDDYNAYYFSNSLGKKQGSIQILRSFDQDITYQAFDAKTIDWIAANQRPIVVPFDDRTIGSIFHQGNPGVILFNPTNSQTLKQTFVAAFRKYSKENPSKLIATQLDKQSMHLQQLAQFIHVNPQTHTIVLVKTSDRKKFVASVSGESVTEDSIILFLNDWTAGTATSYDFDQAVPQVATPGAEKQVQTEQKAEQL